MGKMTPLAFPLHPGIAPQESWSASHGMTLRDWFAGQALSFVDDRYPEWQLKAWFGERTGLMREQIRARAAYVYADAMLAERDAKP